MELTKSEMRASHARILDELRKENVSQAERIESYKSMENHNNRRLANLGGDFAQLWRDERTMRLRYQWLETAATDVVNSCPEHLPGLILDLAEELGIETKETENGDT